MLRFVRNGSEAHEDGKAHALQIPAEQWKANDV